MNTHKLTLKPVEETYSKVRLDSLDIGQPFVYTDGSGNKALGIVTPRPAGVNSSFIHGLTINSALVSLSKFSWYPSELVEPCESFEVIATIRNL